MTLPNKSPYSFGNSWRGCVVQADLVEWEEQLHFWSIPGANVWNERLRDLMGRLSFQQRSTSGIIQRSYGVISARCPLLGNVDEKIGLHELYTQLSLVSPLAMQHYAFAAVAQQMSPSDECISHRFRSSIVYRILLAHVIPPNNHED